MSALTDYEAVDWQAFRDFFDAFQPSGMPAETAGIEGSGWRGVFPETQFISPMPQPSGRPGAPTIYGRYAFDYTGVRAMLDGDSAPVREGSLSTAIRLELGASDSWVRGPAGVFQQLRLRMVAVSTPSFAIFPEGVTERRGQDGNYALYVLRNRFVSSN